MTLPIGPAMTKQLRRSRRRSTLAYRAAAATVAVLLCGYPAMAEEVVIPALVIPERVIPGYVIPGYTIPAQEGPYGTIPEIVIPPVVVPEIVLPSINTTDVVVDIPDYHLIDRQAIIDFGERQTTPVPTPEELTHLPMDRTDRIAAFQGADPHATDQLTNLLADADINRSGDLSWDELTLFQQRLLGDHRYRTNHRALHPSDFVRAGGGDCEDFALMTAVLARFWGWEAFVACFFDAHTGHAIALVNSPLPVPYFYQVFDISGRSTLHGDRIPSGRYVPVDYDHVGGYSDAMHAGMRMEYVMNPDRMYGEVM